MLDSIKKIIDWVRTYWAALATSAAAIMYALFVRRGQEIDQLKTEIDVQKTESELNGLKEEAQHAQEQAQKDSNDYDSLKHSNAELAARLGLSGGQGPGDSNHRSG